MTDLLSALLGNIGGEQDYLAKDPFYNGARAVFSMDMPHATNNTEAILGPLLQGFAGGALSGYGRKHAAEEQYQDYSKSPLIKALSASQSFAPDTVGIGPFANPETLTDALSRSYGQEKMPSGWSPKIGQQDLILGALAKQQQDDLELKRAGAHEELLKALATKGLGITEGGGVGVLPGYAESMARIAGEEERAKAAGSAMFPGVPAALQDDVVKEIAAKSAVEGSNEFISKQFDDAKNYARTWAAGVPIVPTQAKNELAGIQTNLRTHLQKLLGREMNGPEQEKLMAALPDSYDSKAQIEAKKKRFQELITAITPKTPLLDALNGVPEHERTAAGVGAVSADQLAASGYVKVPGGWRRQ